MLNVACCSASMPERGLNPDLKTDMCLAFATAGFFVTCLAKLLRTCLGHVRADV